MITTSDALNSFREKVRVGRGKLTRFLPSPHCEKQSENIQVWVVAARLW
jgi:hypothetical protein